MLVRTRNCDSLQMLNIWAHLAAKHITSEDKNILIINYYVVQPQQPAQLLRMSHEYDNSCPCQQDVT